MTVRRYTQYFTNEQAVREAATICPPPVTVTFDLESGVRVTCSRVRPDVRDRQTDVRQHHRLMPA